MPNLPIVVLQVLPALGTGGVERGTVEMTQAIADAGWVALVASAGGAMEPAIRRAGGRHVTLPLATKNPWQIWRNAQALETLIRTERVAIVHARSRAPAWSALWAARRTGAHFVTTYHGVYGEDLPGKRRYNAVMAQGERVIVASRFVAGLVAARHGLDPTRLRIIPRGVDPAVFDPAAVGGGRLMRLAADWRLPDGAPLVMLPGRLTRWKGQAVLIEALARLNDPSLHCVLVGAHQGRVRYAAELAARAQALGLGGRLRLVGQCDDMPAALKLSDIVVSASIEPEAFGRVVIEAQAMARPVIATDHGGAAETIDQGLTGWRIPPADPQALVDALGALLARPEARAEMGAAARASVQAHFTTAAMQAATMDVYRELLA